MKYMRLLSHPLWLNVEKKQVYIILENEKFFELKSKEYGDGIKRKETR